MSKYNNMKTIPISSLSEQELKMAIKEWAEGSEILEQFLWNCHLKQLETNGCHAGKNPFVGFYLNNSEEEIRKILNTIQSMKGSEVFIMPDGGNPFSGKDWYRSVITASINTNYRNEANEFFKKLRQAMENFDSNPNKDYRNNLFEIYL